MERYDGFGDKASGGAGDNACGEWLIEELERAGYSCARQTFEVPAFDGPAPTLRAGGASASLLPQAIVHPTPGASGPLSIHPASAAPGSIALIVLPFARWSTIKGHAERQVQAVLARGAAAAVLITTGPTGEAIALNAPANPPLFDRPVAVMAPKDAPPFLEAAARGDVATLAMPGRSFRHAAFNVTATLDRSAPRTLVLSTPRSGWFGCAGERGTGLAVWMLLARWAAKARLPVNVALVATSGHEYEYAGGELYIEHLAPTPDRTALWTHLGANVASRDWHERGGLSPLPSADPQRFLLVSPKLLHAAGSAFAGQPGLEAPYAADPQVAAGELASILKAGYDPVVGIFGAHRFHHTRGDDMRCVSPALIGPVARAFKEIIPKALDRRAG